MISWLSLSRGIIVYVTIFHSITQGQYVEDDYADDTGDFVPSYGPNGPAAGPATSPFKREINGRSRSGMLKIAISPYSIL
jgi:hypothetical protein